MHPNDILNILGKPDFCQQLQHFIQDQLQDSSPESDTASSSSMLPALPTKIATYASAVATFYAPSDISGIGGMRSERICAVDTWRHGNGWNDCMFINTDPTQPGMRGLDVTCTRLFFSFVHEQVKYFCAFVEWFSQIGDCADENMGMWSVEVEIFEDGTPTPGCLETSVFAWSLGFQAESSRSLLLMLLKDESSTSKNHNEHKRMFDFPDVVNIWNMD